MPSNEVLENPALRRIQHLVATRPRVRWPWFVAILFLCALGWAGFTFVRVQRQSLQDEARPADAIVVFGAAEYWGRPSPVWRARLDHAFALYQNGIAPMVITTGGSKDPHYTEGGVGRTYLMAHGIPERNLIAETQARNTDESVERVVGIMRENAMHSCVAVSDGYHLFRIKKMLQRRGIAAYTSPRPQPRPPSGWQRFTLISHEVISYSLWRIHIT